MKKIKDYLGVKHYLLTFDDFYNIIAEFNPSTKNCQYFTPNMLTKLCDYVGNIYNNIMVDDSGNADSTELKLKYCDGILKRTFVTVKNTDEIVLILRENDPSALTFSILRTDDEGNNVLQYILEYHTVAVSARRNAEEVVMSCANYLKLIEDEDNKETK